MTGPRPRSGRHPAADVTTGVAAAVLVFGAVPAVLVSLVGLPVPHHWGRTDILSLRGLFDLLALLAWLAWAICCWPLARSVAVRVRGRDAGAGGEARLPDWLAARIAAAVLAAAPVSIAAGATAGASGHRPPAVRAAAVQAGGHRPTDARPAVPGAEAVGPPVEPSVSVASTVTATAAASDPSVPSTYTVQPGDSLWSIAEQLYGDGADWASIAQANLGRVMNDGSRFTDPNLIVPGWVLSLPDPTGDGQVDGPSAAPAPASGVGPIGASTPTVGTGQAGGGTAGGGAAEAAAAVADRDARGRAHPGRAHPGRVERGRVERGRVDDGRRRQGRAGRRRAPSSPAVPLPELVALGVGTLVAAALARRARRSRQMASLSRDEGGSPVAVSELAADTASLLAPFDGVPALHLLEQANHRLSAALADVPGRRGAPEVRLVKVGPYGVDVRVAGSESWAPPGWQSRDHHTWHLPSGADPALLESETAGHDPWLPLLLPVGDNDEGTWLVPLGPGSCLPVLGSGAASTIAAMRLAVESWSWSEILVVSDDPSTVELAVGSPGSTPTAAARAEAAAAGDQPFGVASPFGDLPPVLYIGDPADLSPAARARSAVLTARPALATDLIVVVDDVAATIHPLGITVRPHHLDGSRFRAVEELVATRGLEGGGSSLLEPGPGRSTERPGGDHDPPPPSGHPLVAGGEAAGGGGAGPDGRPDPSAATRSGDDPPRIPASADKILPGQVEVRLLTAFPRIDGLIEDLPPKRARRAVELVAYLAVHHPSPVTSDRLRTRVLGSATADAAAKTLFNTVGAARRAMGRDVDGEALLPPATKIGRYRVSPLVTVDAVRADALVTAAGSAADDEEEMALLRAALDLVEGEPLAGALTGYAWWSAEGHERRVAATLVDGACRLARLAVQHHHVDLARWGIERARLVDPFSEVLSRSAMRLAAETGDADRMRREWMDCQRRVDELEPGSLPSEATETLYVELRRRISASPDEELAARPEEPAEAYDVG